MKYFINDDCIENQYFANCVTQVIRERRSVYADKYFRKKIPEEQLSEILTNATWAPNHKMSEPWRFIRLAYQQQVDYGNYMVDYYKERYANLDEQKRDDRYAYLRAYPLNAACILGIVFQRNHAKGLAEWEEIAAVSCAVHNMALTCTAMQIGSYWASGGSAIEYVKSLGLAPHEQSLGLFFMGYYDLADMPKPKRRTSIDLKVSRL
ncbi:nitroreductase family protein [Olivibacter jilunii]|uniref:nitroreductase family protein n=1 Tax=Olivibacter jilunii TaxID=985016 RepID=UPI003F16FF89